MYSDEEKIQLIRRAISSVEGWRNLAESLQGNPESAKEECIRLLRIIGGDKMIDVPATVTDENGNSVEETVKINFSDKLVDQLNEFIASL